MPSRRGSFEDRLRRSHHERVPRSSIWPAVGLALLVLALLIIILSHRF